MYNPICRISNLTITWKIDCPQTGHKNMIQMNVTMKGEFTFLYTFPMYTNVRGKSTLIPQDKF